MPPSPPHRPPRVPPTGRSPPPIARGRRGGLGSGQVVGSGIGAGLQVGELGQSLLGHGHKKMQRKALRAMRKRNSGNWGKFVRNSYQIRTKSVPNSYEFRANFTVS